MIQNKAYKIRKIFRDVMVSGKDEYASVQRFIERDNRMSLYLFGGLALTCFSVLLLCSLLWDSLRQYRWLYLVQVALCLVVMAGTGFSKKHPRLVNVCVYTLLLSCYFYGIFMGTLVNRHQATVSYLVIIFILPLVFIGKTFVLNILQVLSLVVYLFMAAGFQDSAVFLYNLWNVIPYSFICLFFTSFLMRIKIKRILMEKKKDAMLYRDSVTGLYNRRRFARDMEKLCRQPEKFPVTLIAMDINGLKRVNDSVGHLAGDQLIVGAAGCARQVLGSYGKCYRMGGDELEAVLSGEHPEPEELVWLLRQAAAGYVREGKTSLSFAVGVASVSSPDGMEEGLREADCRMYEDKARYYRQSGNERRK